MGWHVGGVGFWARVWVLNEETFELEQEEHKKRATCKSTFFQQYSAFSRKGLKKIPASCKPASHLVRVYTGCLFIASSIKIGIKSWIFI